MKHNSDENGYSSGTFPESLFFKERRKAYYHGKYHKRMCSLLLLVTGVAVVIARQGV
ncbi:hypothetical protein [Paraglaciecola sp. L3A3]|uniref:hypothetical protein n=1 Tax=Paraglaciecola sp. L3A3 TaxID=2686358 RepID=UPI0018EF318D|nr:hypothetical protein [Paraglaciecola sp. L3A3]